METIYFFSGILPENRRFLEDGNILLHSPHKDHSSKILWKITVFPTDISVDITGFVQKFNDGEVEKIHWNEAVSALEQIFPEICDLEQTEACEECDFPNMDRPELITFTFSVDRSNIEGNEELRSISKVNEDHQINHLRFKVETGEIIKRSEVVYLYGLINIIDGTIPPLEDCVQLLEDAFPNEEIYSKFAWMSYCVDEEAWRLKAKLQDLFLKGDFAWKNG